LHSLVCAGYKAEPIAQFLADNNADIDGKDDICGWMPLLMSDSLIITKILIDKCANGDTKDNMVMASPDMSDSSIITEILNDNGINVDAKDNTCRTPLHMSNSTIITQILIDNGANVNIKATNDGFYLCFLLM